MLTQLGSDTTFTIDYVSLFFSFSVYEVKSDFLKEKSMYECYMKHAHNKCAVYVSNELYEEMDKQDMIIKRDNMIYGTYELLKNII